MNPGEQPEPEAWINFNAATGERNVSFFCESELASIPLWPEHEKDRALLRQAYAAIKKFREWELGQDYDSNRETVLCQAYAAEEAIEQRLGIEPCQ